MPALAICSTLSDAHRQFDGHGNSSRSFAVSATDPHARRLQVKAAGALLGATGANSATAPSIASPGTRHTCSPPMPSG